MAYFSTKQTGPLTYYQFFFQSDTKNYFLVKILGMHIYSNLQFVFEVKWASSQQNIALIEIEGDSLIDIDILRFSHCRWRLRHAHCYMRSQISMSQVEQ